MILVVGRRPPSFILEWISHSVQTNAQFIQSKVLAMALYCVECTEPSAQRMQKLQTAIVETLGAHSARRCNAIIFELHNYKYDLDPHLQQATRRVLFLGACGPSTHN